VKSVESGNAGVEAAWYGAPQIFADGREAEMAYERLDEALRQLKTDRERKEATENQRKKGERGSQVPVRAN
jgi:hypothetical protein